MTIEAFIERFSRGNSPSKAQETAMMLGRIMTAKFSAAHFYPIYLPDRVFTAPGEDDDAS